MKRILFASDLDNTLMFSYKHKKKNDMCVEFLNGIEQGFCTVKTLELLEDVNKEIMFIPVTSRSVEQYKRIHFSTNSVPKYALTTNGAILLKNGFVDKGWLEESKKIISPWLKNIYFLENEMKKISVIKRYRIVDGMYLFGACEDNFDAKIGMDILQDKTSLKVFVSGRKIYVFPPGIDKGAAIERLKTHFDIRKVISAGDSLIDIPMLNCADIAICPNDISCECSNNSSFVWDKSNGINAFPEFVLNKVCMEIEKERRCCK